MQVRSLAYEFSDYPTGQGDPDRDFELEEKKFMAAPVERASSVAKVPLSCPPPTPLSIAFNEFPLLLLTVVPHHTLLISASTAFHRFPSLYCFLLLLLFVSPGNGSTRSSQTLTMVVKTGQEGTCGDCGTRS